MFDWDDLRFFLEIARTGSLSGAARELGVTHSTVFRRLNALEEKLKVRLFERLQSGYKLTNLGEEMLESALQVEDEINSMQLSLSGRDLKLSGTVHITAAQALGRNFLHPYLKKFYQRYPDIRIDLMMTDKVMDLSRREADIALRIGNHPPEHLIGKNIAEVAWAIYGSADYLAENGTPKAVEELTKHRFVTDGAKIRQPLFSRWQSWFAPEGAVVLITNGVIGQHSATCEGLGLAALPCYLGDHDAGLIRVLDLPKESRNELWLLMHPDLKNTARVKALKEFIVETLEQKEVQNRLAGITD